MYEIDFDDSKALWNFGCETVKLAEEYLKARETYANAIKTFKMELAKAYSEDKIKDSISEEKAYILLSKDNKELTQLLSEMVESEQLYKGLDRILEARKVLINFSQSIIKNQRKE